MEGGGGGHRRGESGGWGVLGPGGGGHRWGESPGGYSQFEIVTHCQTTAWAFFG